MKNILLSMTLLFLLFPTLSVAEQIKLNHGLFEKIEEGDSNKLATYMLPLFVVGNTISHALIQAKSLCKSSAIANGLATVDNPNVEIEIINTETFFVDKDGKPSNQYKQYKMEFVCLAYSEDRT